MGANFMRGRPAHFGERVMAIKVKCSCGKALRVQNEAGGKYINCPGCKEPVLVPAPSLDFPDERPHKGARPEFEEESVPGVARWPWIAGILAVMLVAGFGITALIIQGNKSPSKLPAPQDDLADGIDEIAPRPPKKAVPKPDTVTQPVTAAEAPTKDGQSKKEEPAKAETPAKPKTPARTEEPVRNVGPRGKQEEPVKEEPRKGKVGQFTEEEYDLALRFFTQQNASGTVRLGPGWGLENRGQWIMVVLISSSMIGKTVTSELGGVTLYGGPRKANIGFEAAKQILALYKADRETQIEFLRRFAAAIEKKEVAALLVKSAPLFGNKVPLNGAVKLTRATLLDLLRKAEKPAKNDPDKNDPDKKGPDKKDGGDIYYYTAPANLKASNNVEIYEAPNGKIRANVLSGGGLEVQAVNGVKFKNGRVVGRPRPDGLGSTGIRILVKDPPGYTTFAALQFLDKTKANIGMDGTVEVSRVGVRAKDEIGNRYVSKKVMHNGNKMILMVEGKKAAPKPEKPAETDAGKNEKLAASKLTLAEMLQKDGKIARAKERYQEIVDKFPGTDSAKNAKALLEKLKKKEEEKKKEKDE
jgi:hypothetical protein